MQKTMSGSIGPMPAGIGKPRFMMIRKELLHVDRTYQRPELTGWINRRVKRYCGVLCGTLLVARRPDGSFQVYDGGQRLGLANRVSSVKKLPCMVVDVDGDIKTETWLFLAANVERTSVKLYSKYRGWLLLEDPAAMLVDKFTKSVGYEVGGIGASERNSIICIATLMEWARRDPKILQGALKLCAKICNGARIDNRLLNGLCHAEHHLRASKCGESLFDKYNFDMLAGMEQHVILMSMGETCGMLSKAANNVGWAQGFAIIKLLNKYRSGRKLLEPIKVETRIDAPKGTKKNRAVLEMNVKAAC